MWRLDDVVEAVKGTPLTIERDVFSDLSTDSRSVREGELFIPITGRNFDGHLFMGAAYERSHGGTLCEKGRQGLLRGSEGTVILVEDTLGALLDLAHYRRLRTKGTFLAITGSNGKTTTKELLVALLNRVASVHCNEKNYNNLIGVSKSLLSMKGDAEFCVFELGTNSPGEIRQLAEVTEPHVSLITNINASHLEGLNDLDGVLHEKLDLFRLTEKGGKVLINADDPLIGASYNDEGHTAHTFGIVNKADFRLGIDEDLGWEGYRITLSFPSGDAVAVRTNLLGRHNLYNILAASSMACLVGITPANIREGIEHFTSYSMRFKPVKSEKGYIVVDDSYNANPSSMEWAIDTVGNLPCSGKRFAVLGDMKELGDKTVYYHRELGRSLKDSRMDRIFLVGHHMKEAFNELGNNGAQLFEDQTLLIDSLRKQVGPGDVILVKGSRAAKMEEIVEALV